MLNHRLLFFSKYFAEFSFKYIYLLKEQNNILSILLQCVRNSTKIFNMRKIYSTILFLINKYTYNAL